MNLTDDQVSDREILPLRVQPKSSARAQMASYMLVRGGVDEARVERIEGYADRQPRNAADPKAAENRRIEILLRGLPE